MSPSSPPRRPAHAAHPRQAAAVLGRVVAVGDELLSGDTDNTNATAIAQRCRRFGITLDQVVEVRDRTGEIAAAIEAAAAAVDVCLVCGGLGPTTDDLTAAAVAAAAGTSLQRDADALARLESKFARLGYPMPPMNRKQADFPASASRILANPIGSAEGFMVPIAGCLVYAMPGVPVEMCRMLDEQVMPELVDRFARVPTPRRMFRTLGRGESSLATVVEPIVDAARARSAGLEAMLVHYRASTPEVLIVLEAASSPSGQRATPAELCSLDDELTAALAPALYGIGEVELAPRVVGALEGAGLRLAVAESCTGGGLGGRIVGVPGASAVFHGGVIAYSNATKSALLGVEPALLHAHGAVSEPVARAMAEGARTATGADLCVSITGIAGPGGATREKPVGTVHIDVFDGDVHVHKRLQLRGNRGTVQRCSELWALKMVWDRLCARGLATLREMMP